MIDCKLVFLGPCLAVAAVVRNDQYFLSLMFAGSKLNAFEEMAMGKIYVKKLGVSRVMGIALYRWMVFLQKIQI